MWTHDAAEMRTVFPVCRGDEDGEPRGLRGRMRRMPWLKPGQGEGVHTDTEPGVWLRSFQLLDTRPKPEVRSETVHLQQNLPPLLQGEVLI